MAVDYAKLAMELNEFYDFRDKVVLYAGVGRRPLLDLSVAARELVAIDQDATAIDAFRKAIAERGAERSARAIASRFEDVMLTGDVVYLEFCLHEMADPEGALQHARALAPDVVVFDHSPGSAWMYLAAEDEKVRRSADAMRRFGIRRHNQYETEQRFRDYAELLAKFAGLGAVALQRIQRFEEATNIVIPMTYEIDLL